MFRGIEASDMDNVLWPLPVVHRFGPWAFFPFLLVIVLQDPSDGRWASGHLRDVPRSFSHFLLMSFPFHINIFLTHS
jgi:hypothetical protein